MEPSHRFFWVSKGHERAGEGSDDAYGHATTGFQADSTAGGTEWVGSAATARSGTASGTTRRSTCSTTCCSTGRFASGAACCGA